MIGLLILTLVIVHYRKRSGFYLLGLVSFGFYLLSIINIIYFPILLPDNWPSNLNWKDTIHSFSQVNLIPFNYGPLFIYPANLKTFLRDVIGNILLTIPFGFGICFLFPLRTKQILLTAFVTGFILEGVQLVMKLTLGIYFHAVDITDVLTNAFGVLMGSVFFWAIKWIFHNLNIYIKKKKVETEVE